MVTPVPGETPDSFEGLHLGLAGWGSTTELDLGSGWSLAAAGVNKPDSGVLGARLTPDGAVLDPAADTAGLTLVAAPPAPWRLFGTSDGTRIEVAGASFGLELVDGGEPEIVLTIGLTGLRVVLDPGALGGLFASVVPDGLEVAADMTIALSSSDGLRFNGLPGLTIPLVDRLALGPATLRDVVLGAAPGSGTPRSPVSYQPRLSDASAAMSRLGYGRSGLPRARGWDWIGVERSVSLSRGADNT